MPMSEAAANSIRWRRWRHAVLDVPPCASGPARLLCWIANGRALARALDRDELIAAAAFAGTGVGRDRAGEFVFVDLAVGRDLDEFPRLAVGGCGGGAAPGAGGQAAVDAVAVGVVGDDEYAFFRLRGRYAEQQGEADGGEEGSHGSARGSWTGIGPVEKEQCEGNVNAALTQCPVQKRRRYAQFRDDGDGRPGS